MKDGKFVTGFNYVHTNEYNETINYSYITVCTVDTRKGE